MKPIAYINVEKRTLEFAKNIFWHTPTVVNIDRIPLFTKEALAQTQEPVAWMYQEYRDDDQFGWRDEILFTPPPNDPIYFRNITPVYTHPPQRTWVGLTGEEIDSCFEDHGWSPSEDYYPVIKDIEAKLKELNT